MHSQMLQEYLSSLDWAKYSLRYAVTYMPSHVLDTRDTSNGCSQYHLYVRTRCLFSTYLAQYMLNRRDKWKEISLSQSIRDIDSIMAMNIEIDVTDYVDHMFMVALIDGEWFIIQSYIGIYPCIIEKVNILDLLDTIDRWGRRGVSRDEWHSLFHAWIPRRMNGIRTTPYIYATDRIFPNDAMKTEGEIDHRLVSELSDSESYMHEEEFQCLLPYMS